MAKDIKKAIRKAGNNISNNEMDRIVNKSGGSVSKALDKISSVQQSRKEADKTAPSIGSKAGNSLIKQAQSTPGGVYQLGSSKIAQAVRGMAGTPAGPMIQGQRRPGTQPSGLGYVPGGMTIRPSGRLGVGPLKNKGTTNTSGKGPYDGMTIGPPNLDGPGPLANPNTQTWSGDSEPDGSTGTEGTTGTETVTNETATLAGAGMMSGGGMGAAGANKLGRAKSRLRKLGIYGRGTGLLNRGLQYGNTLN